MPRLAVGIACLVGACGRGFFDTPPVGVDARGSDAATGEGNLVFATSSLQTGNLGGLAGADAICTARATEASLPGTYVAYLATAAAPASARLAGSRGWQRVDGLPVADQPSQLTSLRAWYPIALDELGDDARGPNPNVWTGVAPDGVSSGATCGDWQAGAAGSTGTVGSSAGGGIDLQVDQTSDCSAQARLYCFGTGVHPVAAPAVTTGRLAFISSAVFVPSAGGIASADTVCQAEATAAGRTGTFLAALPTTAASTASRFDTTGAPWVRADGVTLVDPAADMFAAPFLRAQLAMTVDGQPFVAGNATYWGGDPNVPLSAGTSCVDWTNQSASANYGDGDLTSTARFVANADICSNSHHMLLCLEQ